MNRRVLRTYEIASAVVWIGIFASVAIILDGSSFLGQILPVLSAGAVFFLLILPSALGLEKRRRRHRPH